MFFSNLYCLNMCDHPVRKWIRLCVWMPKQTTVSRRKELEQGASVSVSLNRWRGRASHEQTMHSRIIQMQHLFFCFQVAGKDNSFYALKMFISPKFSPQFCFQIHTVGCTCCIWKKAWTIREEERCYFIVANIYWLFFFSLSTTN